MLKRVALLFGIAVLAGVVLAAAALPAAALAGLAFRLPPAELPDALQRPTIAQASYVYAGDGQTLITTFYDENRRDVRLSEVAQVMQDAVVAAEDSRFFEHNGVDLKGIARAFVANRSSGETRQGASTLTMQYVRNVLKSDPTRSDAEREAATATTPARKLLEARYALTLEQTLSKAEILERYLNIAYFGEGAYGIYAASHIYFSKDPAQLTLAEAAMLAGMLQTPDFGEERALTRREYTLNAMVGTGAITAEQATAAKSEPLGVKRGTIPNNCVAATQDWGFFCDYFVKWWEAQAAFGETQAQRQQALRQGGYRIVTTLDAAVAREAQRQVESVYSKDSKYVAPLAVVQPGTGKVRALAVNRTFGETFDQLIAGGGGLPGYQAGSTFKMFAMLAALEAGYPLDTGFDAPAQLVTRWRDGGEGNCGGYWCLRNANPAWMDGYRTMWDGFGRSVNTYFVWLHQQIGAEKTAEMAKRLGITNTFAGGSFVIGTSNTFPLELANAYATVAAEGLYCAPLPVESVTTADGQALDVAQPQCKQVLSPDVARAATDAARCPVGQQSAFGECNGGTAAAVSGILGGRPVAGKTGSTDDYRTESFVAYTPQLAAAMIAANPKQADDGVGSAALSRVYRAVAQTLAAALEPEPAQAFTPPTSTLAYGNTHNPRTP
ncbi:transglycosylase domain-containing protein [Allorhizocola rhizosphaerae]|uniref:transglycosylase domain-containing protein n=1 Tax=Allorhizocola rhizosphaerae TaxID=1872709 RepID=UPI000E3EDC8C|nr:transglycosylase domain-containing protein [Allorhizocola rhizosphaerae]